MNAPSLALDPRYRAQRLKSLAQLTLGALGVAGNAPDAATILEHAVSQACAELEAVEKALTQAGETNVVISVVEGIRLRLELALDANDLLAELLAPPAESEDAE